MDYDAGYSEHVVNCGMTNNKNLTVTELGTHISKVSSKKNITELMYLFLNAIFQLC